MLAGAVGLLAIAAGVRTLVGSGPGPSIGGPFTLTDGGGRPWSDADARGRYMLVFFGYTGCVDLCPRTLTEMAEALDRFDPGARRVQPVFITVDPAHDTPQRLRRYVAGFSPTLVGLTGTADQLGAVERQFHVVVEPRLPTDHDELDHTAVIYLLGPDGRFVAPIPADSDRTAMRAALGRYVGGPATGRS